MLYTVNNLETGDCVFVEASSPRSAITKLYRRAKITRLYGRRGMNVVVSYEEEGNIINSYWLVTYNMLGR